MVIDTPLLGTIIAVLLAVVGTAFGYGMLTARVRSHEDRLDKLDASYKTIDTKLDDICEKISSIETTLRERKL